MRVLLLLYAGCVLYDDTVRVKVHDAAAVTATIRPDDARYAGVWIERDTGSIDVWCPTCGRIKRQTIVEHDELAFDGTPGELLAFDGDRVHVRFDYIDRYYCGRRRACAHHAMAVDLDTPRANVEHIQYEHRVSPRNGDGTGRSLITFGICYAAAGALLGTFGAYKHVGVVIGVGAGMMAIGGGAIGFGVDVATASDTVEVIPAR